MNKAIDFDYSPTPNGWKVSIMLEECGLPYNTILINLKKGEQFSSDFLKINPNKKIPAITDYDKNENPINFSTCWPTFVSISNTSKKTKIFYLCF